MSTLLMIDGNSMANRAFYGVPHLTNAKGVPTNAVYGFLNTLQAAIERFKPDALFVAFDITKKVFRHERYADYKGLETTQNGDLSQFVDEELISDWARENVAWAVGAELINGRGNGILDPLGDATRAEVAAILQRFLEKLVI